MGPASDPPASEALVTVSDAPLARPIDPEVRRRADANVQKPRTKGTIRAYATDWRRFVAFCTEIGASSLPAAPQTIVDHLTAMAERDPPYKFPTIERAYASIRVLHQVRGHELPRLREVTNALENIQRRLTERRVFSQPKAALTIDQVIAASAKLPDTMTGKRDRVILLFGEAIAQRRADLSRVHVEDLVKIPEGLDVIIRQSKTDQRGRGHTVAVHRDGGAGCPVTAVETWLAATGITSGPLIRRMHRDGRPTARPLSGQSIAAIVKAAAVSLGLDPKLYGGHSLRRGLVTSASRAGADLSRIIQTTGHKSIAQASKYIDDSIRVPQAAAKGLFATPETAQVHPTTGQPLVNRRRVVSIAYRRDGKPADMKWLRAQVTALRARRITDASITQVLLKLGVRRGDGVVVDASDVAKLQ